MSDVQAAWVLFRWAGFEFCSASIWFLVSEVQNSGSDEQNGLGGGAGLKVSSRHSGNVGTLQEASHRVCDWIPSENPASLLGWGSQYGQKRDGGSRDRRTLSRLEGCVSRAGWGT